MHYAFNRETESIHSNKAGSQLHNFNYENRNNILLQLANLIFANEVRLAYHATMNEKKQYFIYWSCWCHDNVDVLLSVDDETKVIEQKIMKKCIKLNTKIEPMMNKRICWMQLFSTSVFSLNKSIMVMWLCFPCSFYFFFFYLCRSHFYLQP